MSQRWSMILLSSLLLLGMAGCTPGSMAYNPQDAVVQGITRSGRKNILVDEQSIRVLQTLETAGKTFVMASNNQMADGLKEQCIWMFEANKSAFGTWSSGSGGGGCTSQIGGGEPEKPQPMEFGGGSIGSTGPKDPGFVYAYGFVNQADIVKARATWNDGVAQEVAVIKSSYLALRMGVFSVAKLEGLNEKDEVVYQFEPGLPAPAKE